MYVCVCVKQRAAGLPMALSETYILNTYEETSHRDLPQLGTRSSRLALCLCLCLEKPPKQSRPLQGYSRCEMRDVALRLRSFSRQRRQSKSDLETRRAGPEGKKNKKQKKDTRAMEKRGIGRVFRTKEPKGNASNIVMNGQLQSLHGRMRMGKRHLVSALYIDGWHNRLPGGAPFPTSFSSIFVAQMRWTLEERDPDAMSCPYYAVPVPCRVVFFPFNFLAIKVLF